VNLGFRKGEEWVFHALFSLNSPSRCMGRPCRIIDRIEVLETASYGVLIGRRCCWMGGLVESSRIKTDILQLHAMHS
jgi:hypothetical protein